MDWPPERSVDASTFRRGTGTLGNQYNVGCNGSLSPGGLETLSDEVRDSVSSNLCCRTFLYHTRELVSGGIRSLRTHPPCGPNPSLVPHFRPYLGECSEENWLTSSRMEGGGVETLDVLPSRFGETVSPPRTEQRRMTSTGPCSALLTSVAEPLPYRNGRPFLDEKVLPCPFLRVPSVRRGDGRVC